MLTRELIRAQVRQGALQVAFIDPSKASLREDAASLLDTFRQAAEEQWTRAELDAEVAELVGDRRDHKILAGLAKVLADRSAFEVEAPLPPAELRERVFLAARARGPLALEPGPLERPVARDVLAEEGAELGLDADAVGRALYADLREAQRLTACDVPDPEWLLHRYNVALVQAVLLKATRVRVRLHGPSAPRLRQLFRFVKFHGLIAQARRDGAAIEIELDGPASLFRQSTRYGLQLANFFPAVLLQECAWTVDATVLWRAGAPAAVLHVASTAGLRSHYADTGAYTTRTQVWFAERFAALSSGWTLDDATIPLDLGGHAVILPDFKLTRDGRTAYLEIVGFWQRAWLARRLEWLAEYAPGNLILAVSRKLRASQEDLDLPGQVVEFAEVVPAAKVLALAEQIAR